MGTPFLGDRAGFSSEVTMEGNTGNRNLSKVTGIKTVQFISSFVSGNVRKAGGRETLKHTNTQKEIEMIMLKNWSKKTELKL